MSVTQDAGKFEFTDPFGDKLTANTSDGDLMSVNTGGGIAVGPFIVMNASDRVQLAEFLLRGTEYQVTPKLQLKQPVDVVMDEAVAEHGEQPLETYLAEMDAFVTAELKAFETIDWPQKFADALNEKFSKLPHTYKVRVEKPGTKYTKLTIVSSQYGVDEYSRSVYCFIRNGTGDVYKAAGYKAPAKGRRYDLTANFDAVVEKADPFGGFLYIK